ncbi:MAG TPA: AraC family transcriptional regulator [Myxococcaceae bacterium]|nr:AraC family transcriptional regulator [Myxococcaceae bacterium]
MHRAARNDSRTSGLARLETLRRQGKALFQGDRRQSPVRKTYPSIPFTSLDPDHLRGCWVPAVGLLPPWPLVRDVFSSPIAAALLAVIQNRDGARAFHTDEFPDGAVAITFGEISANRGALEEALRRADRLDDAAELGDYFVNVLPRGAFPAVPDFPSPGYYVTPRAVPVLERVPLTAGDVRVLAELLGGPLPWLGDAQGTRSDPFTGPFRGGGHLQFFPTSGERLISPRSPTEADRQIALAKAKVRGEAWLAKGTIWETLATPTRPLPLKRPQRGREVTDEGGAEKGSLARVLEYVQENCTRPLTVADIARAAQLSTSHLHAVFFKHTGQSPARYAAERRLDVAERLLKETDLSVGEVAERCGFAEQTSLTRGLKRSRGVTPSELRRDARVSDRF